MIPDIESEHQKADIFTKVLQGEFFVRIINLYVVGKPSHEGECIKKWHLQP